MDELTNRYSAALLSIASEENRVEEYVNVIKQIDKCLKENEEYLRVLSSSFISNEDKKELLDKAFSSLNFKSVINFLKVIVDNHRADELIKILDNFISSGNDYLGVSEGFVYSTTPLKDKQIRKIEEAISKKLNKKVELRNRIDESLLGGVKVIINDRIYDGSVSYKLDSMKQSLLARKGE